MNHESLRLHLFATGLDRGGTTGGYPRPIWTKPHSLRVPAWVQRSPAGWSAALALSSVLFGLAHLYQGASG